MTWLLYDHYTSLLEPKALRKFYTEAEDWPAVRALDNASFSGETDIGVGGAV